MRSLPTAGSSQSGSEGVRKPASSEVHQGQQGDGCTQPEDRRDATLVWEPVKGADGYVVRYGIEAGKLYNSYVVYDANTIAIHSLNRDPEYYFEVEAFDSGTDYYRERTERTMGRGAEIELARDGKMIERKMIKEGLNEYVFDNIVPGVYTFRHTFGPVLWRGELTKQN